jgi:hypothetical protein
MTSQYAAESNRLGVHGSTRRCVEEGRIASYQWKGPFELLEMESSGAFLHSWWAIEDLNL